MKQFLITLSTFLFLAFLFSHCKSNKAATIPKPPEVYDPYSEPPLVSTLTIPVNIITEDLVRTINNNLSGKALYEDYSFDDNNEDGLMMNAWKSENFTMYITGNTIKYRVPLKIWMKKELVLGAAAEAEGNLALSFKTVFSLKPDWSIQTQTEVEYHEWIGAPVLKTGIGNVSVQTIANLALNRSKKTLAQTLDQVVSTQFTLKPYVREAWDAMQEPVLLDSAYGMWVKTTPQSIAMTPLVTNYNGISAKIAVTCVNDINFGTKPVFRSNTTLPDLVQVYDAPDEFQVRMATDVPYTEAEKIANAAMKGQVFESGKKKVRIERVELWGNKEKAIVNATLSGSFNGNIYFIGRPEFNAEKNQIEIKDMDFNVETRNVLYKSAAWLFQGPIKKQMAAAMVFPLQENINALKTSVQETLNYYEIKPGIVLTGILDTIAVENTALTPQSIRVNLYAKGKINIDVKGL